MDRARMPHLVVTLAMLAFLTACGDSPAPDTARWEQELMDADRRFAAEVAAAPAEGRAAVWATWFTPSGIQIVPADVVTGPTSITSLMDPFFASAEFVLSWEPDLVRASPDGQMGWTSGRYESRGPAGELAGQGRYLTLWGRQDDGTWKIDLDTGVPDPEE